MTWADQKTGDMASGGSDRVGATPTQLGVGGDGYRTMERGTVAGPRRATHGEAMAYRSFVG